MQQFTTLWSSLTPQRRVLVGAATVGVFVVVIGIARLALTPGMALLYSGLDPAAAGEIVTALEARGQRYIVQGDAIHVEERVRDETRMMLAGRGLPRNPGAGYELLDGLSGFGTTSQMFDAAYWRAKEGELARTIIAAPQVSSARVHIAPGSSTPFRREVPPTASVTLSMASGTVTAAQAQAFRFLVASAVAGLTPADVAIIDSVAGVITASDADDAGQGRGSDRTDALRRSVERLLEAHVGPGRVVVELSVDTVTERETIVERRFDPEGRVAISTESEERASTSTDSRSHGVTVASNLPDGDAAEGDGRSESRETHARERVNFEVSETQREVERQPGAIRRITAAVLIDGQTVVDDSGVAQWRPRPEAELLALRDLVASAIGFDEARGDVIAIRSLPFEEITEPGTLATSSWRDSLQADLGQLLRMALLLLAILLVALFVLRPILQAARRNADGDASAERDQMTQAGQLLLQGTTAPGGMDMGVVTEREGPAPNGAPAPDETQDPIALLRARIAERQSETVELLRHWMDDRGDRR